MMDFQTLTQEVARLLPGDWQTENRSTETYGVLHGPDDMLITLWKDSYKGRVEIRPQYPTLGRNNTMPPERRDKPLRATVALSRGPKAVADAIIRRILPEYEGENREAQKLLKDWKATAKAVARTKAAIEKLLGLASYGDPYHVHIRMALGNPHTSSIAVRLNGPDDIHLELSNLPLDVALLVLGVLRNRAKEYVDDIPF